MLTIRAEGLFRKLLGRDSSKQPISSKNGTMIGSWDVEAGVVTRTGENAQGSRSTHSKSYDDVIAEDNARGQTMTSADWIAFFGLYPPVSTPDPAQQTYSYRAITFFIDEQRLAQPGGLASDVLITLQIATELAGIVDPTGVADGLNAAVLVADGQYAAAAVSIASIAVPFGAEKLAKAVSRVPVGQLDNAVDAMHTAATAVGKKVGNVTEAAGKQTVEATAQKGRLICPDGSNCFVTGTLVLARKPQFDVAQSESDYDGLVALGAFGTMIALTVRPKSDSSESKRKRKRRRSAEFPTV